ncbi:MAG: formyltransferase family protein [Candidatus Omnitrophica bacterium]|nr:formyltransferase family protein [Candidatus Omnitrophota bacterium]
MKMKGVLFLAGHTARSQAYAQAMVDADLHPEYALFFGTKNKGLLGQPADIPGKYRIKGLFVPDLSIPLAGSSKKYGWNVKEVAVNDVNNYKILTEIKKINPALIIYSGYGGQIVGKELIGSGIGFLHMHSGWLPDYKGSTTLYYSWLADNFCGVSAILLNATIDGGAVVARKKYGPPAKGIDVDYVYDSAIRADLLVSVLKNYIKNSGFKDVMLQKKRGTKYFVIHPVLKHLARLSAK